jgi:hypothetical protein
VAVRRDGVEDCLDNSLGICQYIVVPESQNSESLGFQPTCTFIVVHNLLRVLTTVDFNDYPAFETQYIPSPLVGEG